MLDDLKYIHNRDGSDALGVAAKQWQQLQQTYDVSYSPNVDISNVVVAGMGGSALAASFVTTWPGINASFEVVRDYHVPKYVNKNTLFIASSYSGNTEEILAAIAEAQAAQAQVVVISAGGKLADIAHEHNHPLFLLPNNLQPRMAVFYNFAALIQLLTMAKLVDESAMSELKAASDGLQKFGSSLLPEIPTKDNQAKQIALEIVGKSPVVYASSAMFSVAYKWKINFNENAKNIAWCNQFSEFNHNEFIGWSSHPIDKPYAPIYLQSSFDHPQITKRFEVSARLLSGKMPNPIIVQAEGSSVLQQLLSTVILGDFVSLYVALLNNIDPTPVDLIEKLKKELA